MARPLLGVGKYVCDFRLLMRARLLFGLYNQLAVPKRYQIAAKLYCSTILLLLIFFMYYIFSHKYYLFNAFVILRCMYFSFNIVWSIFTEDKHISSYFTRIDLTDVTVDSAIIFCKVEKILKYLLQVMIMVEIAIFLIFCGCFNHFCIIRHWHAVATFLVNISVNLIFTSNYVVFCVLSSRLLLLRLKLERYSFRSARHCRIGFNIYCDMYSKIIEELQRGTSFKITIIAELVCTASAVVFIASYCITKISTNVIMFIPTILAITSLLAPIFGYCFELEKAASHVEAIREFTATELMKQPCERSRRAMLELLALTEAAPARVSLCRAVRVDARLAVAVLSFCSARVILLLQTLRQ